MTILFLETGRFPTCRLDLPLMNNKAQENRTFFLTDKSGKCSDVAMR